ncbi:hypothetical protein F2P81_002668 [Scophthalmus maximus]|uniref:Uncharacterized protein n=1 Tax=Scophthalmus maximus TaxID=52904 RepID=A0A6A4TMS3_SCOMX|nr:hypothetical protein F2P81_002668 [Scophthalmus maximus]
MELFSIAAEEAIRKFFMERHISFVCPPPGAHCQALSSSSVMNECRAQTAQSEIKRSRCAAVSSCHIVHTVLRLE